MSLLDTPWWMRLVGFPFLDKQRAWEHVWNDTPLWGRCSENLTLPEGRTVLERLFQSLADGRALQEVKQFAPEGANFLHDDVVAGMLTQARRLVAAAAVAHVAEYR